MVNKKRCRAGSEECMFATSPFLPLKGIALDPAPFPESTLKDWGCLGTVWKNTGWEVESELIILSSLQEQKHTSSCVLGPAHVFYFLCCTFYIVLYLKQYLGFQKIFNRTLSRRQTDNFFYRIETAIQIQLLPQIYLENRGTVDKKKKRFLPNPNSKKEASERL